MKVQAHAGSYDLKTPKAVTPVSHSNMSKPEPLLNPQPQILQRTLKPKASKPQALLKGSWDLVNRVIIRVSILIAPNKVLITLLAKSHDPPK